MEQEIASSSKGVVIFLWIGSIIIAGITGFFVGKNIPSPQTETPPKPQQIAQVSVKQESPTPTESLTGICSKTGIAQKKDYLVSYTIQPGDTIASIAQKQLGDAKRDSEILKLNQDASELTIGSTLYLPPPSIKQSAGNISQVSGMIVGKDNGNWHISFGGGTSGPGILLPTYWFQNIANSGSYKLGDCVTILFDNGVKVFSVTEN